MAVPAVPAACVGDGVGVGEGEGVGAGADVATAPGVGVGAGVAGEPPDESAGAGPSSPPHAIRPKASVEIISFAPEHFRNCIRIRFRFENLP